MKDGVKWLEIDLPRHTFHSPILQRGFGWLVQDRDEKRNLDVAFRLTHDTLQAVAATVCTGFGLIQTFDALREYVQQHEYNDDMYVGLSWPRFSHPKPLARHGICLLRCLHALLCLRKAG